MFWKKEPTGGPTLQLQEMAESPPLTGTDTAPSTLADIDSSPGRMPFKSLSSEKNSDSPRARPTIIDPCSRAQRRYFCPVDISLSRGRTFVLEGKADSP
ncbi:MAG: hypothetical protein BYD32DRAFT_172332 [Podila humilis]|nr:MAG: hypothetical protein BYD32DRAFT_172332 [Podila humilis]